MIVEVIFGIPNGLGFAIGDAITARQYIALQDYIAVVAIVYVLVNFASTLLYRVLDPRIRVLESAEPDTRPARSAARSQSRSRRDEVFEQRKIGVLAWIGIGWLAFVVLVAVLGSAAAAQVADRGRLPAPAGGHLLGRATSSAATTTDATC